MVALTSQVDYHMDDERTAQKKCNSPDMVFIVASPRSGTNALAWALAQHPMIWTSGESNFLLYLFGKGHLQGAYKKACMSSETGWLKANQVSFEEFAAHLGAGVDSLYRSRCQGKVWIEHTPMYSEFAADTLTVMFPHARFLHLVRDGRSVVCSMLNSGFRSWRARSFFVACFTWVISIRRGLALERACPGRTLRVRQEDMVDDPQRVIAEVLEFVGLRNDEHPVQFLKANRINSSFDNDDGKTIHDVKDTQALKVRRWSTWSYLRLLMFRCVAGGTMRALGYSDTKQQARVTGRLAASAPERDVPAWHRIQGL